MPIATGGGTAKKTTASSIVASKRKTVRSGTTTKGGAGSSQTSGFSPADYDKPTGLSAADKAAKKAAQAEKSAAKHATRRRIESRRDTARAGGRTKGSEPDYVAMQGTTASDITRSRRAFVRAGGQSKVGGTGAMREADRRIGGVNDSGMPVYQRSGGSTPRSGGSAVGGSYSSGPRQTSLVSRPIDHDEASPTRPGGGFEHEFGSGYRPPPAFVEFGASGGGGGQTGGSTNPLASDAGSAFQGTDLDELLHGQKKRGRAKRTRRTE